MNEPKKLLEVISDYSEVGIYEVKIQISLTLWNIMLSIKNSNLKL
jgi:hypothetical protein